MGQSAGLAVHEATLEEFVASFLQLGASPFDAVTLLNVLEHVPDPVRVVQEARALLRPGGIICIRVPNDFTELQEAAQRQLGCPPWWIASPDHINYFDVRLLEALLNHSGFEVFYTQTDFPMEMFLLMGDMYVGNPELGNKCHQKRVQFDLSLPEDLRRRIYHAFAEVGIGRDTLTFARKTTAE